MNAMRDLRESVKARLLAAGCSVHAMGPLDMIVGAKGYTVILGVEQPGLPEHPRRWDRKARDFLLQHRGWFAIIHSPQEAIDVIQDELGSLT